MPTSPPRAVVQQLLAEIDFIVFPLESATEYAYRASSLLADAITFLKPIIAPRSGIFEYMHTESHGSIGWLYSGYDELSQFFERIP